MLATIMGIAKKLVEAGGSVVGFRGFTEEPAHTSEPLGGGVEIRHYPPRIAAQTTVTADELAARQAGFRRLAGYIFGGNHPGPVARSGLGRGEKIAMTAPVAQQAEADGQWVIRFFMPADKTLESLPAPDDSAISLVSVPAETVAVQRFSGGTDSRAVSDRTAELLRKLDEHGLTAVGSPAAWFYDPPWTLPFLRRNEVSVAVVRGG